MDFPDPPLPFRLEGRTLAHPDAPPVRLSPQEATFLRLMVDRAGRPVTRAMFHGAGVGYPAQVKNRLERRLERAGIELHVRPGAGGTYTLPVSEY